MTVLQSDVDLSQELRETVAEIAAFDIDEIQPGSMLFDDIGLDSIMMMDIFATLTKRYPELRSVDATDPRWREDMPYRALENALLTLVGVELESTDDVAAPGIETMQRIVDFNAGLRQRDVRTYFVPHENVAGATVRVGGRELINYGSYNYLGSNGDERINRAVAEAIDTYGTSVSAARIIGGEIPLHQELEQELADFLGVDDALVLVGGHSTNVNVIGHLFGDGDLILHDSLAHNSIIQGALMSSARRKPFRHNDPASLEKELSRLRGKFDNVLVVVEGIYSMDGDIAALEAMLEIKERYGAFLMVDEAHSFGTIGEAGRGITSHGNVDPRRVDILMGTLSKALNSCGGLHRRQRGVDPLPAVPATRLPLLGGNHPCQYRRRAGISPPVPGEPAVDHRAAHGEPGLSAAGNDARCRHRLERGNPHCADDHRRFSTRCTALRRSIRRGR